MNQQESKFIKYTYYLALMTLFIHFFSSSRLSIMSITIGAKPQIISIVVNIAVLVVVIYRAIILWKQGIKIFSNKIWLKKIGFIFMVFGIIVSLPKELILYAAYLIEIRSYIDTIFGYFSYLHGSIQMLVLGLFMYELSRITSYEQEDNKANSHG